MLDIVWRKLVSATCVHSCPKKRNLSKNGTIFRAVKRLKTRKWVYHIVCIIQHIYNLHDEKKNVHNCLLKFHISQTKERIQCFRRFLVLSLALAARFSFFIRGSTTLKRPLTPAGRCTRLPDKCLRATTYVISSFLSCAFLYNLQCKKNIDIILMFNVEIMHKVGAKKCK